MINAYKKITLFAVLLISTMAFAADDAMKLLCVTDKKVGFSYDEDTGDWMPSEFAVNNERYLFTSINDEAYEFRVFGSESLVATCSRVPLGPIPECVSDFPIWSLRVNPRELKFQLYMFGGYLLPFGEDNPFSMDTPSIAIGTCSRF